MGSNLWAMLSVTSRDSSLEPSQGTCASPSVGETRQEHRRADCSFLSPPAFKGSFQLEFSGFYSIEVQVPQGFIVDYDKIVVVFVWSMSVVSTSGQATQLLSQEAYESRSHSERSRSRPASKNERSHASERSKGSRSPQVEREKTQSLVPSACLSSFSQRQEPDMFSVPLEVGQITFGRTAAEVHQPCKQFLELISP